jgi:hypothetical protein
MTWSTTEEDSLFLNLLTSNPVAENMCSDDMDVPGILRYWRASTDNLGYFILFSFHHFKGFTLGSHLSRVSHSEISDECFSFKWLSILLVPHVYVISKLQFAFHNFRLHISFKIRLSFRLWWRHFVMKLQTFQLQVN